VLHNALAGKARAICHQGTTDCKYFTPCLCFISESVDLCGFLIPPCMHVAIAGLKSYGLVRLGAIKNPSRNRSLAPTCRRGSGQTPAWIFCLLNTLLHSDFQSELRTGGLSFSKILEKDNKKGLPLNREAPSVLQLLFVAGRQNFLPNSTSALIHLGLRIKMDHCLLRLSSQLFGMLSCREILIHALRCVL
jgi:hypothetical protein